MSDGVRGGIRLEESIPFGKLIESDGHLDAIVLTIEGFDFVGMARALLREPDLPNRLRADPSTGSLCIHCDRCMPTIYSGTRCPLIT
jgi:2,4-dienoyl-CoA reductase-like NADH-dependent reductase (Old Yellow Enzyme family)